MQRLIASPLSFEIFSVQIYLTSVIGAVKL